MVYMVPLCTLPVPLRKIHFSQDSQIHEVQVQKAILYPLTQSNGSKICTWPGQTWSLENVSQIFCMCSGPSFIAKYNCGRAEKSLANF